MNKLIIKKLEKNDVRNNLEQFIEYSRDIIPVSLQYWDKSHFLSDMQGKWEYSAVCFLDNSMLGYLICSLKPDDRLHINKMAINKNYRSLGIGKKLLKFVEKKCIDTKVLNISAYTNIENILALKFYQNNCFIINKTIQDDVTQRYYLIKNL